MALWTEFGFRQNPYATTPVPASEDGVRLLVGRTKELRQLKLRISSSSSHPTIEGDNGVGKTSLVAVAGFELMQNFLEGSTHQLIIPVTARFQLKSDSTATDFCQHVLFQVARSFISHIDTLRRLPRRIPDVSGLEDWLNSPSFSSGGGGVNLLGLGGNVSRGQSGNTSSGFSTVGFQETVRRWLADMFPDVADGGFLCVIDNLELLETSKRARALLEELRDEILNQAGLRWVLCGARGIIRAVASSPRLQGVLSDPVGLAPIADENASIVVRRRLEVFGGPESYAPVEPEGFRHLYEVSNRNLRVALKFAEDFALYTSEQDELPESMEDKSSLLKTWMAKQADQYEKSTSGIGRRAWEVFDGIVRLGGSASPSDYGEFGFESSQAMRPHVKSLEQAQLVESAIDETDHRRRTIGISPRGWLVQYKRSGYKF